MNLLTENINKETVTPYVDKDGTRYSPVRVYVWGGHATGRILKAHKKYLDFQVPNGNSFRIQYKDIKRIETVALGQ